MKYADKLEDGVREAIQDKDWYRHGMYRDSLLFSSFYVDKVGREYFEAEGINDGLSNLILLNEQAFITTTEFEHLKEVMYEKIRESPPWLQWYIRKYREDNEDVLNHAKHIRSLQVAEKSNDELAEVWGSFIKKSSKLIHWLWSMEFLNYAIQDYLQKRIQTWRKSWNEKDIAEFLSKVSYVDKDLPFQQERREALELEDLSSSKFKTMFKQYQWLKINTWDGVPFTKSEYEQRIQDLRESEDELQKKISETQEKRQRATELIEDVEDEELQELLKTLQELIYLKSERINVFSKSWYYIQDLVHEIRERLDLSFQKFLNLKEEEVAEHLRGAAINKDELEKRDNYAVVRVDDQMQYYHGEAVEQVQDILLSDNYRDISRLNGTSAYKGTVRGTARVINTDNELDKLQPGDVLVCNLTNPDYNSAFGTISGLVTDEGGLLCHSAIMAREFQIPCVIGTKKATRAIKDGDVIEVRGKEGTVRILERS